MKKRIQEEIKKIESEKGVTVLYACESGSRAWGFPSPTSDFDVRFIYRKPLKSYLSINDHALHLTFPINEVLDIGGWDLKKVLQLIKKSNSTPFEWLQSPIVYYETAGFKNEVWELCKQYFNKRATIFHYLGVAKGALETINNDQVKIKKLFYIVRPLLAAQWCMEKNETAPMNIEKLMQIIPENLRVELSDVIEFKKQVEESYLISISGNVKQYINETFTKCSEYAKSVDSVTFEIDPLDNYFIEKLGVENTLE